MCQIRSCILRTERVCFFPRFHIEKPIDSSALEPPVPLSSSDNNKMASCKHCQLQTFARSAKIRLSPLTKPSHFTRMHTNQLCTMQHRSQYDVHLIPLPIHR